VITDAYNAMLAQCQRQGLSPTQTPADVFDAYMRQHYCSVARYSRRFSHGNYDGGFERNRGFGWFQVFVSLVKCWEFWPSS
jgi:hypothetical protein